jgi:membrane fusion protein (multidrug efflux system)
MKLFTASFGGILVAAAISAATSVSIMPERYFKFGSTSTDNAYVRADVTPLSPKVAGYITEVAIRDNQPVRAGDILFRIDDADYKARVAQSDAALKAKQAAVANLDSRLDLQRAVIEQARAALQGADADADRAEKQYQRFERLVKSTAVSQESLDQARSDSLRADAKVAEAKANLAAAGGQIAVLESQRPQLLADIDAVAAALKLARIELDSTAIRSPADGWVGERQARVGQYVRPGSLLIAFVAKGVWVVANFKETQIPELRVGAPVSVAIDSVPGAVFSGIIDSLSPASGAQFALLPPDNATGNFTRIAQRIPVRIALSAGQSGLDQLRAGMSATVSTDAQSE